MVKRSWFAYAKYPNLSEFIFGTVFADSEEHARIEIGKSLAAHVPPGFEILAVIPGAIHVVDGDFWEEGAG